MTRQQYWIVAGVAALTMFIGVGVTVLATSGDDDEQSVQVVTSTSSTSTSTTTLPPTTTSSTVAPVTTAGTTATTITPGTTLIIPPSTTATTKPLPTTTTRPRPTTTTRASTTTTSTTEPRGRTDVGITATEIRLAVIADDSDTFQGMTAWRISVNRRGGIAERKVRLDLYETGETAEGYVDALTTACDRNFAIVGSFSVFDVATDAVDCGEIPDLPVEAVAAEHMTAGNAFSPFPRQPDVDAVGPYRYLRDEIDGCCSQYVLVPDTEPSRGRTLARIDAATAIGFDNAGMPDVSASDSESRYDELVTEMEANGATFAASGLGADSTLTLRRAAEGKAASVVAWFCDAECYDPSFLSEGGDAIDSQYVAIETTPFSDRADIQSLRSYYRITTREDDTPTYSGLRAYVTGMLFERAAKSVVEAEGIDGLTRVRLLDALAGIHDFDAGGILGPTDVGARAPTGCYVLLQVQDGKFARVNPAEKGSLSCGGDNVLS